MVKKRSKTCLSDLPISMEEDGVLIHWRNADGYTKPIPTTKFPLQCSGNPFQKNPLQRSGNLPKHLTDKQLLQSKLQQWCNEFETNNVTEN